MMAAINRASLLLLLQLSGNGLDAFVPSSLGAGRVGARSLDLPAGRGSALRVATTEPSAVANAGSVVRPELPQRGPASRAR